MSHAHAAAIEAASDAREIFGADLLGEGGCCCSSYKAEEEEEGGSGHWGDVWGGDEGVVGY